MAVVRVRLCHGSLTKMSSLAIRVAAATSSVLLTSWPEGSCRLISRLYLDTATLIWNGNGIEGKDNIQKFWTDLPPSDHSIFTLDAQPITGPEMADQLTFLVKVGGQVKYDDKISKSFSQCFLITAMGDKWKIVSDCFRVQEILEN
ncbi:unnamed protein product, partial [Heterotrigona itama]